ncbi:MAG: hypothetical protein DMG50_01245 [Acidobacteria bacterium]|nr:MAG: hypothetical protein DMG50_01245 [Acidobacteriota bacterium]
MLMPTVFTYGRGLAGRQIPGQPLPDHGAQEYDEIHGGIYTALHAEFRAKSRLQDVRAPNRQRRGAVDNYTRGNQCTLEIISLRTPDSLGTGSRGTRWSRHRFQNYCSAHSSWYLQRW